MKIIKVYLHNFKWVKWTKILEFEKISTFLIGPNGFWKTTIFDAIEICLTWELYRITDETSKIVKWNKNVWKPFYQHDAAEVVVLKLLFELETWEKKVLVSYDDNKKQKAKPWKIYFERFLYDYEEDDFLNNKTNFDGKYKITSVKFDYF